MHNIDRTQDLLSSELDEFEAGDEEFDTGEIPLSEEGDWELPLEESEEMELASDLLEVTDDAELDQFLGKLFKKASRGVGRFMRSSAGRRLGGMLKGVAKKALPIAGGALGGFFGGPLGAKIGSQLASAGGRMFGLELEGLSPEDQEFEIARRFVRLASSAAQQAASAPPSASPVNVAKKALIQAAKRHAPGILGRVAAAAGGSNLPLGRSGRWVRRGRRIVLMGV